MIESKHYVRVRCNQLMPGELPSMGDKLFILYTGKGLEREIALDIELSNLLPLGSRWLRWQFIVTLVPAHMVGLSLLVWMGKRLAGSNRCVTGELS